MQSSDRQMPASHCGGPGLFPGRVNVIFAVRDGRTGERFLEILEVPFGGSTVFLSFTSVSEKAEKMLMEIKDKKLLTSSKTVLF